MSNPEMNVLYGILLSFSSGPKARPIIGGAISESALGPSLTDDGKDTSKRFRFSSDSR